MGILKKDWRKRLAANERERRSIALTTIIVFALGLGMGYFIGCTQVTHPPLEKLNDRNSVR